MLRQRWKEEWEVQSKGLSHQMDKGPGQVGEQIPCEAKVTFKVMDLKDQEYASTKLKRKYRR